jgi:hypothetical protein
VVERGLRGLCQRAGERLHPLELEGGARQRQPFRNDEPRHDHVGLRGRELLKVVLQVAAGIVVASVILFLIGALIEIAWR